MLTLKVNYSNLSIYRASRGKGKMHVKWSCTVNRDTAFCRLKFSQKVTERSDFVLISYLSVIKSFGAIVIK